MALRGPINGGPVHGGPVHGGTGNASIIKGVKLWLKANSDENKLCLDYSKGFLIVLA